MSAGGATQGAGQWRPPSASGADGPLSQGPLGGRQVDESILDKEDEELTRCLVPCYSVVPSAPPPLRLSTLWPPPTLPRPPHAPVRCSGALPGTRLVLVLTSAALLTRCREEWQEKLAYKHLASNYPQQYGKQMPTGTISRWGVLESTGPLLGDSPHNLGRFRAFKLVVTGPFWWWSSLCNGVLGHASTFLLFSHTRCRSDCRRCDLHLDARDHQRCDPISVGGF